MSAAPHPDEARLDELLGAMTLQEKVSMLTGASMWYSTGIERLGIPSLKVTDGPNGARGESREGATSACFPCGTALAATWNVDLVGAVGREIGEETKSKGAHILLGPTVNIHRAPLAGRNFECYSEDPYLSARMAKAFIEGTHEVGVGTAVKHFVCNDSEYQRMSISSEVGERALREIYLPPFEAAVREAGTWSVMSAYNRVNGIHASGKPTTPQPRSSATNGASTASSFPTGSAPRVPRPRSGLGSTSRCQGRAFTSVRNFSRP